MLPAHRASRTSDPVWDAAFRLAARLRSPATADAATRSHAPQDGHQTPAEVAVHLSWFTGIAVTYDDDPLGVGPDIAVPSPGSTTRVGERSPKRWPRHSGARRAPHTHV